MKTLAAILALALALPVSVNVASAAERGGGFRGGGAGFHGGFGGFRGGFRGAFGGPRVYFGIGAPLYDPFWPGYYAYPYPPPYPEYYAPPPYEAAPPAAQTWYYCDDPQGYYPNVQACNHAWQPVAPPAG